MLPSFAVTERNAADLAQICVRLDGLPLALELTAVRLKLFTPAQLADRLGQRLRLLTGGPRDIPARHRTLHAAITWSHDLLTEPERVLFRRLSVFTGPWTLEAAERVCAGPGMDTLAITASLLDKSLIRGHAAAGDEAGPAFVMLESLREYAAGELSASGEEALIRARHAAHFAELATRAEGGIGTTEESYWRDWLGQEHASTTMELVALGRPFVYFPLRRHWEQQHHVAQRLSHYRARITRDFATTTPAGLAAAMRQALRRTPRYRPIPPGGAEQAARRLARLLTR